MGGVGVDEDASKAYKRRADESSNLREKTDDRIAWLVGGCEIVLGTVSKWLVSSF